MENLPAFVAQLTDYQSGEAANSTASNGQSQLPELITTT